MQFLFELDSRFTTAQLLMLRLRIGPTFVRKNKALTLANSLCCVYQLAALICCMGLIRALLSTGIRLMMTAEIYRSRYVVWSITPYHQLFLSVELAHFM